MEGRDGQVRTITDDEDLDEKNTSTNRQPYDVTDGESSRPVRDRAQLAKKKVKQWASVLSCPPEDIKN